MLRTRVGYCGGTTESPTYRSIGDHAETIQIDFDPTRISYEKLLEYFWTTHNPCRSPWSRQYMSAVFYHDEAQKKAIDETRQKFVSTPDQVQTEIAPLDKFWIAEDYHQKYRLRHDRLLDDEMHTVYPDEKDYVNSTAVMRLNAYLDGHGKTAQLDAEIDKLGLSKAGREHLRKMAR